MLGEGELIPISSCIGFTKKASYYIVLDQELEVACDDKGAFTRYTYRSLITF